METQTGTNGKGTGNGIGKGFPRSDKNPTGYTLDDRARRDKPKERESKRGAVKGRTDSDGQDAVIKIESLQTKVDQLVKLHNDAADAANDYNEAVKKVAEDSGLLAATVNKFVKAKAGDRFEDQKKKALQLALVFEEVAA